jgi:hypothetical protein
MRQVTNVWMWSIDGTAGAVAFTQQQSRASDRCYLRLHIQGPDQERILRNLQRSSSRNWCLVLPADVYEDFVTLRGAVCHLVTFDGLGTLSS